VDGLPVLDEDLIPNEAGLHPGVDQSVMIDGQAYKWTEFQLQDFVVDLHGPDETKRNETYYCAGYAVTYLVCETEKTNLVMEVGSAEQAKIILNGQEVYRKTDTPQWEPNRDTVTGIHLKAGANVLVFKLVGQANDWKGSVRITEAQGKPVPGLRFTLDPDRRDTAGLILKN
jgi:hypothetical protein